MQARAFAATSRSGQKKLRTKKSPDNEFRVH